MYYIEHNRYHLRSTGKENAGLLWQVCARVRLTLPFAPLAFLSNPGPGKRLVTYRNKQIVFTQGDLCEGMFYIQKGRVKISVISKQGKEAVVAILNAGDFMGENCLAAGENRAVASATALSETNILLIEKKLFQRTLHDEQAFADFFLRYVLSRNVHFEAELIDQIFNSSEKRLARLLLLMARYGKPGEPEPMIPRVTQETLAEMIGTTRSRISKFMNKFRELGLIDYDGRITVHKSLLTVVLHDTTPSLEPPGPPQKKERKK